MEVLNVIAAAIGGWLFGAVWYMALARPWMQAAGIAPGPDGRPQGSSARPMALAVLAMVLVAGMMRHIFGASGIATPGAGLVAGLGIGAFFIAPWIMLNNAFGMRPFRLTLIDGGYAIFGCGVIGLILALF
ncbi:DUF1761 domain-containing protein [Gemmobacter denitrificans]|uniref:DUF1761 domain-containing protein n=1 Tax=Gemmobacter denitrificans TaxID=3123040 RepID=A0ABU8BST6_9RHOB